MKRKMKQYNYAKYTSKEGYDKPEVTIVLKAFVMEDGTCAGGEVWIGKPREMKCEFSSCSFGTALQHFNDMVKESLNEL